MTETSVAVAPAGDPSARIVRIESPIASPGDCGICGKNAHPLGFADARLDFEFYGTFYLCADCVGEYANLFGYLSPADFVNIRQHIEAQNLELNTLRQAVATLESTLDGLISDAHRRITDRVERDDAIAADVRDNGTDLSSLDEPDEKPASSNPVEPVSTPAGTDESPAEPSVEQRPDDVYDTTSADAILGL